MIISSEMADQWLRAASTAQTPTALLESILGELQQMSGDDPLRDQLITLIARHPQAPFAALVSVMLDNSWQSLAEALACNPLAPAATLASLMLHNDPKIRRYIALNPATPKSLLALLADEWELEMLDHPNLAQDIQQAHQDNLDDAAYTELAQSPFAQIRCILAARSTTPIPILEQLAQDQNWRVRVAVAQNLSTPAGVLAQLADDRDWADEDCLISLAVASHPKTPTSTLEKLAMYTWDGVMIEAVCRAAAHALQQR